MTALKRLLHSQGYDQPALAVSIMLIGLFCLSLQDAIGKVLSSHWSLWQFQTTRAVLNIIVVLLLARYTMRGFPLLPLNSSAVLFRSLLHVCALTCFFGGAPFLTMAQMAGGLYTFPLFVAVLSAVFLRERVGVRRVCAIVFGFFGTLLILRPGTESFTLFNLLPVLAGFFYANFIIITRRYCKAESPVVLTLVSNVTICIAGIIGMVSLTLIQPPSSLVDTYPFLLSTWLPILPWTMLLIAICTLFNVIGNISLSKAYQSAESSFLAPFDYTYLIFASFWGFIFWADIPGPTTMAGMVLIAGSGIFVAVRERRLAKLEAKLS